MSIPENILVHTAIPLSYLEPTGGEWAEGEPGDEGGGEATRGVPFACVLFLPGPSGEVASAYRRRMVQVPTLLFNPTRSSARAAVRTPAVPAAPADQSPIVLAKESDLLIYAPELASWTGGELVRWQLVGFAQPLGPPGGVIAVQAQVRQVLD